MKKPKHLKKKSKRIRKKGKQRCLSSLSSKPMDENTTFIPWPFLPCQVFSAFFFH